MIVVLSSGMLLIVAVIAEWPHGCGRMVEVMGQQQERRRSSSPPEGRVERPTNLLGHSWCSASRRLLLWVYLSVFLVYLMYGSG